MPLEKMTWKMAAIFEKSLKLTVQIVDSDPQFVFPAVDGLADPFVVLAVEAHVSIGRFVPEKRKWSELDEDRKRDYRRVIIVVTTPSSHNQTLYCCRHERYYIQKRKKTQYPDLQCPFYDNYSFSFKVAMP